VALSLSSASYAAESISICHVLVGYTNDSPTVTFNFYLDIANNGTVVLSDAKVSIAPIGIVDRILEPIPASGAISANYTIQCIYYYPRKRLTIFLSSGKLNIQMKQGKLSLSL
jgi:hypothetical protein